MLDIWILGELLGMLTNKERVIKMNDKTLIIYDLNGTIIGSPITGFYQVPNGVPYIEVVIPSGKYVVSVNVETKEPILEDIPPTETEILGNKISNLIEGQQAILRGDMQTLAYCLYPEDFKI